MACKKVIKQLSLNVGKKNLLITTVGRRALDTCAGWYREKKKYDVMLIYYDLEDGAEFIGLSDYFIVKPGFKYPTIFNILSSYPQLVDYYDFFFLPDDDIVINSSGIDSLFDFARKMDIAICQPSLSPLNYNHEVTVNNPDTRYRYVRMVEVMCPLFSKNSLKICLPSFNESQSGWGLEPVWARLLGDPLRSIAVYDGVVAFHSHPSDRSNGALYLALNKNRIDPHTELETLLIKYNTNLAFNETWAVYKSKFQKSLYRLIKKGSSESIDELALKAFYLHIGLIKTINTYYAGHISNIWHLLNLDSLVEIDKNNLEIFSSILLKNKSVLLEVTRDITTADQRSFASKHPIAIKTWLNLCEREMKNAISLHGNKDEVIKSFHLRTTNIIYKQLKITDKIRELIFFFIREVYPR